MPGAGGCAIVSLVTKAPVVETEPSQVPSQRHRSSRVLLLVWLRRYRQRLPLLLFGIALLLGVLVPAQ